jgi:hypothetical protein
VDRALVVIAVLAAVAVAAALLRRRHFHAPQRVDAAELGLEGATPVGVVGFSSRYCIPCQEWEAALGEADIRWRKIDVGERPELARKYGLHTTPLVLAVRVGDGQVLASFHGHPRDEDIARVGRLVRG